MSFTPRGNEGSLNGVTAVDVVTAPAGSTQRLVKGVNFYNKDSAAVTITVVKDKAGADYELAKETLQVGESWTLDNVIVLDATDEQVQAFMSGAAATTNPTYDAAFADVT
jgi:hypothetical protein